MLLIDLHRRDSMWCVWVRKSEDSPWEVREYTMHTTTKSGAIQMYNAIDIAGRYRNLERRGLAKCIPTTAVPTEELGDE
jgi:hypothetical protein